MTSWGTTVRYSARGLLALIVLLVLPQPAHASLFSPEVEDKIATFLALFVIFVVPVVLIVAFWLVHILPEQIAHKRNHPQFEAIRTLCLLSLVFGGLLGRLRGCGRTRNRWCTNSRTAPTSFIPKKGRPALQKVWACTNDSLASKPTASLPLN